MDYKTVLIVLLLESELYTFFLKIISIVEVDKYGDSLSLYFGAHFLHLLHFLIRTMVLGKNHKSLTINVVLWKNVFLSVFEQLCLQTGMF